MSGTFSRGNADGEIFINIRSGIRGTQMPGFSTFTTDQTWQMILLHSQPGEPRCSSCID